MHFHKATCWQRLRIQERLDTHARFGLVPELNTVSAGIGPSSPMSSDVPTSATRLVLQKLQDSIEDRGRRDEDDFVGTRVLTVSTLCACRAIYSKASRFLPLPSAVF